MPILGYDTAGGSSLGSISYVYGMNDDTDELGGCITKFHVAISQLGATDEVKIAVADANQVSGDPSEQSVIEWDEWEVVVSDDNELVPPTRELLSADTTFFIGIISSNNLTKWKYDAVGMKGWSKSSLYGNQFPETLPAGFNNIGNFSFSIWVDYQHPGVLGYDTAGASATGQSTIYYGISDITDGIGGNIKTFHAAIATVHATLKEVKIVCAETVDGNPSNCDVVEQVAFDVEVSDDEDVPAVGSNILDPDTKYYLAIITEGGSGTTFKYDSGSGKPYYYKSGVVYADQYPSPLPVISSSSNLIFSIWIDYEAGLEQVETPIFDPAEGTYYAAQDVTISCETEDATIKYTTDDSEPSQENGIEYSEPVDISETTTLKAIAYKVGMDDSEVESGVYTVTIVETKPGWFHSTWFPINWWHEDWWTDYGIGLSDFVLPSVVSASAPQILGIVASKDPDEPKVEKTMRILTPKVIRGENI